LLFPEVGGQFVIRKRVLRIFVLAAAPCIAGGGLAAQSQPPAQDNTRQNQRDRSPSEATADQAKNTVSDRDAMQRIRKSVMSDKSLSTYAHNVKVISQSGQVTLKGPVRSEEEKRTVEQKAAAVVGADHVRNEITIQPPHGK
jgi:hyperosmotically inducible periplasmic protein